MGGCSEADLDVERLGADFLAEMAAIALYFYSRTVILPKLVNKINIRQIRVRIGTFEVRTGGDVRVESGEWRAEGQKGVGWSTQTAPFFLDEGDWLGAGGVRQGVGREAAWPKVTASRWSRCEILGGSVEGDKVTAGDG